MLSSSIRFSWAKSRPKAERGAPVEPVHAAPNVRAPGNVVVQRIDVRDPYECPWAVGDLTTQRSAPVGSIMAGGCQWHSFCDLPPCECSSKSQKY